MNDLGELVKANIMVEENADKNADKQVTYISSLINNDLSYYFINKVEESNIVIGQQQLEALGQIISIIKNKNREDKMETLKKNNIQKCIMWCERHQIPYNKFTEKANIFLPLFKSKNKEDGNHFDIAVLEQACFDYHAVNMIDENEVLTGENAENEVLTGENAENEVFTGENAENEVLTGENVVIG